MALHSQFTLIGHKETSSDNALSSFCLQKLLNSSFLSNLYHESSYINGCMNGWICVQENPRVHGFHFLSETICKL